MYTYVYARPYQSQYSMTTTLNVGTSRPSPFSSRRNLGSAAGAPPAAPAPAKDVLTRRRSAEQSGAWGPRRGGRRDGPSGRGAG